MTSNASSSSTVNERSGQLKLSDVIRIVAPENELFNHKLFFIDYVDEAIVNLVNMDTMETLKLRVHEGGVLGDGTIEEIVVVSRAKLEGYARQHGLVVGKWIDVYFDGPVPSVLTCEITNLESDMIEVRVYNGPDDTEPDYLYFNFDYKGLPRDIQINRIELRSPPEVPASTYDGVDAIEEQAEDDDLAPTLEEEVDEERNIVDVDEGSDSGSESDYSLEEGEIREKRPTPNTIAANKALLTEYIITSNQRKIGASLDMVETEQTVDKSKERYTLTSQRDDLLDDLVMKEQKNVRGFRSTNNIAIEIERFVQLRASFSLMDKYFNVTGAKINTDTWKPLVEDITRMRHNLMWVLPVTKTVRNIYDVAVPADEDIEDINSLVLMEDIESGIQTVSRAYMGGTNNDVSNKYRQYVSGISSTLSPFSTPDAETTDIIGIVSSPIDQLSITNNLGNFRSSCLSISGPGITTSRMVKQQYVSATTLPVTRDPNMNPAERTEQYPASMGDTMAIRSIMTTPYSIARFSSMNRPSASIAQKCHHSTLIPTYFKTLGRKTKIRTVIIDSLSTPSRYNKQTYDNFTNYQIGADMTGTSFDEYIRAIVPTTDQLIKMVAEKEKRQLNLHDFVGLLEPYSVYIQDITKLHHDEIKKRVSANIVEFMNDKKTRWKMFGRLKGMKHSNQFSSKAIIDIPPDNTHHTLAYQYNQLGLNYSSSELLSKMINLDYGSALANIMSRDSIGILVHEKIDSMLDIFQGSDVTTDDAQPADKKCKMVVISKQYFTQEEMERDNKVTIYFDRKYDDTNYTMLIKKKDPFANTIEKFDAEYSQMTPENFFMFIRKKVRGERSNSVTDAEVDHLTETLIIGKKRVRDGDYAVLHESSDGGIHYLKRTNDTWKVDDTMSKELPSDMAALNCNLEPGCIYNESAASVAEQCTSVSDNKATMHANILKEIINRFDEKIAATAEELRAYLGHRVARSDHLINVMKTRRTREICKYDLQQYAIGTEMVASGVAQSAPQSPHMKLKNEILAQKNLNNKYSDLVYFINKYTEECVDGNRCDIDGGEASRWRYCKETKTRLLPVFMHELALAWLEDGDDYAHTSYQHTLQRIIRESGSESDDGAYWVDRFSGETIARKDFDTEEGFDNGRKIVTRGVAEEDFEARYLREIRHAHATVVKYTTPETKTIYRVTSAIAGFMNINLSIQMEFIVKLASSTLMVPGVLSSEAEYKQLVRTRSVDAANKLPSYETIYNETIMFLTLGAVLIGIQTSVPSVVTKKTYPGCIRSFAGYPLDGDGDTSGLAYLACVARKGTTTAGVWSVLRRKSPENIMKKIKLFIDTYYATNLDVTAKMTTKREHLIQHPEEMIPDENRVEQWGTFMPPLRTVRIHRLEPLVSGFRDMLVSDIKMGSSSQWSKLDVIQGKLVQFSMAYQIGVQQTIDEIKGHRTGIDELFIDEFGVGRTGQQSNHSMGNTQHEYFSNLNGDIMRSEKVVSGMQNIVTDVKRLSRALSIFCNIDDKNARASLGSEYSEVTIYRAFISICQFNRQSILDDDLSAICGGKPENFSKSDAMSENIRKLKDAGKVYDGEYLHKLLHASGAKNQVNTQYDSGVVTQVQRLRNVMTKCMETMVDAEDPIAEVMRALEIVLDTFDYDTYRSSPDVRALRNVLSKQSDNMRKDISMFISTHTNLSPAQKKSMTTFMTTLTSWDDDDDMRFEHSSPYYNMFAFMNTYIQNLSTVFPKAILSKVTHDTTMSYATAKRNRLSHKAVSAINTSVASDYAGLETFYNEPSITHVLAGMRSKCETVMKLAAHTPYFTEIPLFDVSKKDTKGVSIVSVLDKTTCKMLFEYYLLTTMQAYVKLSADDRSLNLTSNTGEYSVDDLRLREESEIPTVDPTIYMSDMKKMQTTTANLLHQYVRMMYNHKNVIQSSYASIMNTNFMIREGEKELITSRLENMKEQTDRDLDNIKKANKQGVWGKGLQKSLRFHVKEDYDNEREFVDKMQEIEQRIRTSHRGVTEENLEQYKDDYLADMDRQTEEDEDERDMSRVRGDDADGDPYGEEDEDEDEY